MNSLNGGVLAAHSVLGSRHPDTAALLCTLDSCCSAACPKRIRAAARVEHPPAASSGRQCGAGACQGEDPLRCWRQQTRRRQTSSSTTAPTPAATGSARASGIHVMIAAEVWHVRRMSATSTTMEGRLYSLANCFQMTRYHQTMSKCCPMAGERALGTPAAARPRRW
jgi:hypothetical protein